MKKHLTKQKRPYVILNSAMTLDGKIATKTGDSQISSVEDWNRVRKLRAQIDAIMIGINTLLTDNPKLTVKPGKKKLKVVVDSLARTPTDAKILKYKEDSKVIIAVTNKAPYEKVKKLKEAGANIVVAGSGRLVNLNLLLRKLANMGVKKLLLEGGGTLNWSMTKKNLVDEVRVAVAPTIVGGIDAVTLVEGDGYSRIRDGFKLRLTRTEMAGDDIILIYKTLAQS